MIRTLGFAAVIAASTLLPAAAQTPAMPSMPSGPAPTMPAMPVMPGTTGQPNQAQMMEMMQRAAHNQLGVLEYCQANGSIGQDVIDVQKRVMAMLPPAQVTGLDEAEAVGKKGTVQFAGNEMNITDAAKARNTTPDAMCKQMGSMIQAQAANLPK